MTSHGQGSFGLVVHQTPYFQLSFLFLFSFLEPTLTFQSIFQTFSYFLIAAEITFSSTASTVVLFLTHYTVFFQGFDFILEHKGKRKQFYLFFPPTCIFYPRNAFQYISVEAQVLIIFSGTDHSNFPDDVKCVMLDYISHFIICNWIISM